MAKYEPGKKRKSNKNLHLDKELSKNKKKADHGVAHKQPRGEARSELRHSAWDKTKRVDTAEVNRAVEKKKLSGGVKALITILIILAILIGGGYLAMNLLIQPSKTTALDESKLGLTEGLNDTGVEKLLLFGIDGDESYSGGRSDTIIIAAINKNSKKIKLISILRDTRVQLDDFGMQKINAAYAFGGPTLAINTVNRNFKQDIKNYISVDFSRLSEIVDMVGGVDIEITAEEAEQVNSLSPGESPVAAGVAHLNGAQAVAFSRIRSIDSDYERTGRQHKVINAVFSAARSLPLTKYPSFISDLFDTVETSLSSVDVLKMALLFRDYEVESYAVPDQEYETDVWGGIDENGMWVWVYDLDAAADRIKSIISE